MKDIAVDPETVSLWLVDHSYDRAIKNVYVIKTDLCCLIANLRF